MPVASASTGSPSTLDLVHGAPVQGFHVGLFVAVWVVPLSSGHSYTEFTPTLTYGPTNIPLTREGAVDCQGTPYGWVELWSLMDAPQSGTLHYNAGAAVSSIIMASLDHNNCYRVTPGSLTTNHVAGTSCGLVIPSGKGRTVISAFACSKDIQSQVLTTPTAGLIGGNQRVLQNIGLTGNAQNALLADAAGDTLNSLTARAVASGNWGAIAFTVDPIVATQADNVALTDSLQQGLTGGSSTGVSVDQVKNAASTVATTANNASGSISDAQGALAGGAGSTDFGSALADALASWVANNGQAGQSADSFALVQQLNAAASRLQSDLISSMQNQMKNFYGGAGGTNVTVSQSFTDEHTLPAGFTVLTSTIAKAAARSNTQVNSDTQASTIVWTSVDNKARYIFIRMNSAGTSYLYAKVVNAAVGNCEIGCVVAGVKTVFVSFALPGSTIVANSGYTLSATARLITLTGPNGLNQPWTDPSTSQAGASYRYGGFGHDGTSYGATLLSASGTFPPPSWVKTGCPIELVPIGAGGSGAGSNGPYINTNPPGGTTFGYHGSPGTWNPKSYTYGTEIPTTTTLNVAVGAASASVGPAPGGNGTAGGNTVISGTGMTSITANGGAGGVGTGTYDVRPGVGPGNTTLNGVPYSGGSPSTPSAPTTPGVGGWGGSGATAGYRGSDGAAWITPFCLDLPGKLSTWSFYDNGPTKATGIGYVDTNQTTTSTTYANMATVGPAATVKIGPNGLCLVGINCRMGTVNNFAWARSAIAVSGANTLAADDSKSIGAITINGYGGGTSQLGSVFLYQDLSPGDTTFTQMYRTDPGATANFLQRNLFAIPL